MVLTAVCSVEILHLGRKRVDLVYMRPSNVNRMCAIWNPSIKTKDSPGLSLYIVEMDGQANQGPPVANFAATTHILTQSLLILVLGVSLAWYLLSDPLEPLDLWARTMGEASETFNRIVQVVGPGLNGMKIAIKLVFGYTVEVFCAFASERICPALQSPREPQVGIDPKALFAHTQEMVVALHHLSWFLAEIGFPRRACWFITRTSGLTWSDYIQEALKAEEKIAFDKWDTMLLTKASAVFGTRSMIQELKHQYLVLSSKYFALNREPRLPMSWATFFWPPSEQGRDDLLPDILTVAGDVTRRVDGSRRLLAKCSYSSKDMKEGALRLQELSRSYREFLLEKKSSLGILDFFLQTTGTNWRELNSRIKIKEWSDFEVCLDTAYDTAVAVDKMCSDLDAAMGNWMRSFNSISSFLYDPKSDSLIKPFQNPGEFLDILKVIISIFDQISVFP